MALAAIFALLYKYRSLFIASSFPPKNKIRFTACKQDLHEEINTKFIYLYLDDAPCMPSGMPFSKYLHCQYQGFLRAPSAPHIPQMLIPFSSFRARLGGLSTTSVEQVGGLSLRPQLYRKKITGWLRPDSAHLSAPSLRPVSA